jgi:flagellar motor switch protein FliN/FliY
MNEWMSRLAALLGELTAVEVSVENAGTSREPAPGQDGLWWKCSSTQPPLTVRVGMDNAAAAALLGKVLKTGVPSGELKKETRKLLERLDEKGEVVDQGPPGGVLDAFDIRFPDMEPLRLYVAANDSDVRSNLEVLKDIELPVTLRFGTTRMTLQELTCLNTGSVIEFDGGLNDPVDVLVNGRVIARGEAVIVQDSYAVRISEIASPSERISLSGAV